MTSAKAGPKKVKKLSLKRATVKDLDLRSGKGEAVRGGRSSSGGSVVSVASIASSAGT